MMRSSRPRIFLRSLARDDDIYPDTEGARAETVAEKPSFRAAFRQRRCLIPADAFYEWKTLPGGKQPFTFRRQNEKPMTFAGLWEQWIDPASGEQLESATIIVTNANPLVASVHDRMPVVLDSKHWAEWLDPVHRNTATLTALLQPCPGDVLIGYPVDPVVGHPRCDGPECLVPTGPQIDVAAD